MSTGNKNDRILMKGMKSGDCQAFEEIYLCYHQRIFFFAKKFLNSNTECENVVQDVFMKFWEKRHSLDNKLNINAYLFMMTKNRTLNISRQKKNELEYLKRHINSGNDTSSLLEDSIIYEDFKKTILDSALSLPKRRRQVYKLRHEDDLSYKEIAQMLNISTKTVENHMNLALRHLKAVATKYQI